MIRAFRGISFTLSLLAPLLAENNIQDYNEPMDYSKGDVSLQPFNNQTNQETQPSTNYNNSLILCKHLCQIKTLIHNPLHLYKITNQITHKLKQC